MTTVKQLILKSESIELGDDDILDMLNNKTNLLAYEDLERYSNIDEVLGPYGACVILYQRTDNNGHWACIFRTKSDKNVLNFFDPYGIQMDEEIKKSEYQLSVHDGQIVPHLSDLISRSRYRVIQNTHQYQQYKNNINDCGRHCIVRLIFRNLSPVEYYKFITNSFQGMNPDDTVSMLTVAMSLTK
jgi:hypothetical protein